MDEYKEIIAGIGASIGLVVVVFFRRFLLKLLGGHPDWQELKHMIGQSHDKIDILRKEFNDHAVTSARIEERQRALADRVDKLEG